MRPVRVDFEDGEGGAVLVHIVIEQGVSELLCTLSAEGDLTSARLIEH